MLIFIRQEMAMSFSTTMSMREVFISTLPIYVIGITTIIGGSIDKIWV
jgi:hypothetical protein